ncbi:MAG: nuclear transport factor 2 family protein [Firmicutes bacterium]|nr:nuclear transport factor 2 family protein [Alicyclobacillaceae bacterium]MCL6497198.1 nuclear transport factor 2 family protein [Bacillota bacterium]
MTEGKAQVLEARERTVAERGERLGLVEDLGAIRALQDQYGAYRDKCLSEEGVALFSPTGEVRCMAGFWKGRDGVRRLDCGRLRERHGHGRDGPRWGYLLDHLKRQGVIPVSPDRKTARARFRWLMPAAMRGRRERRGSGGEGGLCENEYVTEDGAWKIWRWTTAPRGGGLRHRLGAPAAPDALPFHGDLSGGSLRPRRAPGPAAGAVAGHEGGAVLLPASGHRPRVDAGGTPGVAPTGRVAVVRRSMARPTADARAGMATPRFPACRAPSFRPGPGPERTPANAMRTRTVYWYGKSAIGGEEEGREGEPANGAPGATWTQCRLLR